MSGFTRGSKVTEKLKLVFVIGANATGKTHFITQNYRDKDVEILNIYDYQTRAYEENGSKKWISPDENFRCLMRANSELLNDIIAKLSQGKNVVVEQTFYKAKRRIVYIEEIRKRFDVMIEFYVMCPSDAFWKSNIEKREQGKNWNFQRYKRDAEIIEFPNPAEGMDTVYEVVDGEPRLRMDPATPDILDVAKKELQEESENIHRKDDARQKRKELLESMKERKFWHYCEVCGKKELLTTEEAFNNGWDYPPKMGYFGLLGPRTCGDCLITDTLFWKVQTGGGLPIVIEGELTPEELVVWNRIKGEPESLLEKE